MLLFLGPLTMGHVVVLFLAGGSWNNNIVQKQKTRREKDVDRYAGPDNSQSFSINTPWRTTPPFKLQMPDYSLHHWGYIIDIDTHYLDENARYNVKYFFGLR